MRSITHVEFGQKVLEFANRKEEIQKKINSGKPLSQLAISERIPITTFKDLCKANGITWESTRGGPRSVGPVASDMIESLVMLYEVIVKGSAIDEAKIKAQMEKLKSYLA